ncbi:MAG: hypothetical protein WD512_15525 [Candidatus Paceibacterota bacterium]
MDDNFCSNICPILVIDKILLYHISNRCCLCQLKFKEIICNDCSSPLCSDCAWFCHKCGSYICNNCTLNNRLNSSIICRSCYRDNSLAKCTVCDQDIYPEDPGITHCSLCAYHNEYICFECAIICQKCGGNGCYSCCNACDMCAYRLCDQCMGDGICQKCHRRFFCGECLTENNGVCVECVDIDGSENQYK